jgi:hypothetical protein
MVDKAYCGMFSKLSETGELRNNSKKEKKRHSSR